MASTPHIWTVGIQALPTKDPFAPITFELLCRIVRNIGRLHSYVILPRYSINFKEFIMKQRLLLFLVVLLTFVSCINSQGADSCRSSTTCHECIGKAQCAWCSMENFATSRCDSPDNLKSSGCPPNNISNPESKSVNEEDNNVGPKVQVQPQRIRLDLRSGQTTTVQLTVRPAENYPVDLYYLMDMSYSMKNDLEKLTKLASKIAASMRNITANFKLGFGSFVDKTVSPYIRTETAKPCLSTDQDATCVPTYGFRHILSLVGDEKQFEDKIKEQIISGNLDEPEGGFDALMQVAVCETKIGWSANGTSRRLVIFVTDAPFHVAGDGKLGGIVTPNDGKCHLEDFSGNYMLYTKSNELDYPSLAQLHDKLQQSNVLPIFAVVKEVSSLYQGVTTMWSDLGAVTGELAGDSSNVVDLIERKYQEIVSSVSLVYNAPEKVSVTVKANCGANAVSDQTQKCSNVKIKEKVTFDVSVTLEQCPQDQADQQKSFTIRVPGFGAVVMELNYICQCECEKPIMAEANSSKCTEGNGTFACGQCDCNKGRYGEYCQCDTPFDKSNDQSKCKSSANATDELPCSGNGECACGKCVCKAARTLTASLPHLKFLRFSVMACPGPVDCSGLTVIAKDYKGLLDQPAAPKFKGALCQIFVRSQPYGGSDKSNNGHRYDTIPMANGMINAGMSCQLIHYVHEEHDKFFEVCKNFDFIIVRCNPGQIKADGGDQNKFDDGMRGIRKLGIQVWPSPDVMEKMGAKDALCKVATMNIGLEDTLAYYSPEEFAAGFKKTMAFQPRVIKQNRGSSGEGIWIIKLKEGNYCASYGERSCEDGEKLLLMEANDNHEEEHTVAEFIEFCVNGRTSKSGEWTSKGVGKYLEGGKEAGGQLVDQRFCPRIVEGELRYNLVGDALVGIIHKKPKEGGISAVGGTGSVYTYYGPEEPLFAALTNNFLKKDLQHVMPSLELADEPLPLWWTTDFINSSPPGTKPEDEKWIVGEFNCSCVGISRCLAAYCKDDTPTAGWDDITEEDKAEAKRYGDLMGEKALGILSKK